MPFNFSAPGPAKVAKLGVIHDGDTVTTVGTTSSQTATGLSAHSIFTANPVRTGTGTWTITTKDNVVTVLSVEIQVITASGTFVHAQENTPATVSLTGQKTFKWTFYDNASGTDTAVDLASGAQFRVYVVYSETKVSV